eukprot:2999379-Amphidinium_carterae.2
MGTRGESIIQSFVLLGPFLANAASITCLETLWQQQSWQYAADHAWFVTSSSVVSHTSSSSTDPSNAKRGLCLHRRLKTFCGHRVHALSCHSSLQSLYSQVVHVGVLSEPQALLPLVMQ